MLHNAYKALPAAAKAQWAARVANLYNCSGATCRMADTSGRDGSIGAQLLKSDDRNKDDGDDGGETEDLSVWSGVDLSQLSSEDANGTAKIFRAAENGPTVDAMALLKKSGINTFRMRQWVKPCADGRCSASQWDYAGQAGVLEMARRVKAANMSFVLDLHYSDWWADPGHQRKPNAWLHLSFAVLAKKVESYSKQVTALLVAQGTPPYAVQIGNEITNGMLWHNASIGQTCGDGGKLYCGRQDAAPQWKTFGHLVAQGIKGARAGAPSAKIAIHTDLGNHICNPKDGGCANGIARVIAWYKNLLANIDGETIELIGLSTYPQYSGGTVFQSVKQLAKLAAAFPEQKIYIAETSYPAVGKTVPLQAGYPISEQGQLAFIKDVRAATAAALGGQNGGVLWWEGGEQGWGTLFGSGYKPDPTALHVARPALLKGFD